MFEARTQIPLGDVRVGHAAANQQAADGVRQQELAGQLCDHVVVDGATEHPTRRRMARIGAARDAGGGRTAARQHPATRDGGGLCVRKVLGHQRRVHAPGS